MPESLGLTHGLVPAIAAALLVALIAASALGRRDRHERRAGVRRLCAMTAADVLPLVLLMLKRRGFEVVGGGPTPRESRGEFLVQRGKSRYLVHTELEAEGAVELPVLEAFAANIALQAAEGGFLIATCKVPPRARAGLSGTKLELIGPAQLWRELTPVLPERIADDVRIEARATRRRRLELGVLATLATGAAVWGFTRTTEPDVETVAPVAAPAAISAPSGESTTRTDARTAAPTSSADAAAVPGSSPIAGAPTPPPAPEIPTPTPPSAQPTAPAVDATSAPQPPPDADVTASAYPAPAARATSPATDATAEHATTAAAPPPVAATTLGEIESLDETTLAQRRNAAADAARAVAGVGSAEWSTRSTLIVGLAGGKADDRRRVAADVCAALLRYEELRYTRIQVQDLTGGAAVTWRSCQ